MYCGDYNYCEDHSETCRDIKPEGDTPVTTIVLSVLVSVLVVALAVGIVYGCCCRNRRLSCRNAGTSDNQVKIQIDTGLDKKTFQLKIVNIFLPIIFSICFGCSKEPSH